MASTSRMMRAAPAAVRAQQASSGRRGTVPAMRQDGSVGCAVGGCGGRWPAVAVTQGSWTQQKKKTMRWHEEQEFGCWGVRRRGGWLRRGGKPWPCCQRWRCCAATSGRLQLATSVMQRSWLRHLPKKLPVTHALQAWISAVFQRKWKKAARRDVG